MSIYGEEEGECPAHGAVALPPRPEAQLSERRSKCPCPKRGQTLHPRPTREARPLTPTPVCAFTKRHHEERCRVAGTAHGIDTVDLRFFDVCGPGQALSNPCTGVPNADTTMARSLLGFEAAGRLDGIGELAEWVHGRTPSDRVGAGAELMARGLVR